MKCLVSDCCNAVRLTAAARLSAIFAGADIVSWRIAPNAMRKVLDAGDVNNKPYHTTGKTMPVVGLRACTSALTRTIAEYIKAIGRSRKTKRLWNSASDMRNTIRQWALPLLSVRMPQKFWKQYLVLRELPQPVFRRVSTQLYVASLGFSMLRGGHKEEHQYGPGHPEYVSLKNALRGGYIGGFIESFCVFWLILGVQAVLPALGLSSLSLTWIQVVGIVLGSCLIFPVVLTMAQRPLVVRAQRPSPGGVLWALCEILVPPLVYVDVALAVTQDTTKTAMVGVCALVFYLAYAAWLKPWTPGFTRAEIRSKFEQTKQMTRELVGETVQERADIDDPAVKNLFLPGNRYRMPLDDHGETRP